METRKREYSLDFLKIVATLLIVMHHYQQRHGVWFEGGINFSDGRFYFGYMVELFFVLSGYFMYGYMEKIRDGLRFSEFFSRRYIRFLPMMMITAFSAETLKVVYQHFYAMAWDSNPLSLWDTIATGLGIQAGWGFCNPGVNNPTWYISVLLLCYIVFYTIVWLADRFNVPVWRFFVFMMILGFGIEDYEINLPFICPDAARGYYAFFWGLILAELLRRKQPSRLVTGLCLAMLVGFPFAIANSAYLVKNNIVYMMTYFYYSAAIIVFTRPVVGRRFRSPVWGTLANISYNVFMWHIPLFTLFAVFYYIFRIVPDFSAPGTITGMIGGIYLFGTFSYFCIDRPARRFVSSIWKKWKE